MLLFDSAVARCNLTVCSTVGISPLYVALTANAAGSNGPFLLLHGQRYLGGQVVQDAV